MKKYGNYCTEEQTELAHKLGAPIAKSRYSGSYPCFWTFEKEHFIIPTTQEMFGWLREQNIFVKLRHQKYISDAFIQYFNEDALNYEDIDIVHITEEFSGDMYKECEISAIDIALDYLEKRKNNLKE